MNAREANTLTRECLESSKISHKEIKNLYPNIISKIDAEIKKACENGRFSWMVVIWYDNKELLDNPFWKNHIETYYQFLGYDIKLMDTTSYRHATFSIEWN